MIPDDPSLRMGGNTENGPEHGKLVHRIHKTESATMAETTPDSVLGKLSIEDFLRHYWQKKPLLIRQAIPGFESPLAPEDLAGLACEEDVPARLILENAGDKPWSMRQGPFTEEDFTGLPENGYSLLVTDCEKLIPELMTLVERFRFVPDWRIDDLMISYAPPGGSVGAHIDEYDVFLLQAHGTRRWMIEYPVVHTEFRPGLDVRILEEFEATEEWVLEPGDMLYLPPGVPHHGVAVDRCMTYSIGFRAPTLQDLTAGVTERLVQRIPEDQRYGDPDLKRQGNPGALVAGTRTKLREQIREAIVRDDTLLDRLLAETLSERPIDHLAFYPENEPMDIDELRGALADKDQQLMRTPAARLLLVDAEPDESTLAVDGEGFVLDGETLPLARLLTEQVFYDSDALLTASESTEAGELLAKLYRDGVICWRDPEQLEG